LQVSSPNPRPTPQKKLDIELPYDLAVLPWIYTQRNWEQAS
jgi:hypothetical protein